MDGGWAGSFLSRVSESVWKSNGGVAVVTQLCLSACFRDNALEPMIVLSC